MTNRDQKKPNCPVCGKYTAARGRIKRRACEPFCTVRCAAEYGRFAFADARENVWDVQSRCWVDNGGLELPSACTTYLYIEENGWMRREPKRWHSKEDE